MKRLKLSLLALVAVISATAFAINSTAIHADTVAAIQKQHKSGYLNAEGQWLWFENGQRYTGFRHYMGTYYWFENGVRADNGWHFAWGFAYYTGKDGRALQGEQTIDGQTLNFGDDNTFYLRYFDGGSANPGDDPRRFMQPVTELQFDYDENGHPIPGTAYWDN